MPDPAAAYRRWRSRPPGGRRAIDQGEGTGVFDEELSDHELDQLEALGAAEDAELILGAGTETGKKDA
jgi:hypothetical protein